VTSNFPPSITGNTQPVPGVSGGADSALVRALGVRGLSATLFNILIGAGIFILPATAAGLLGTAAPFAYLACAVAMALIVLCFAAAGSRVSLTGGPYAYVDAAFGGYAGWIAGVLLWLLMSFATAAVANGLAISLGQLLPMVRGDGARVLTLALLLGSLAWVNVRGVQQGKTLIELVTVAKLLPLVVFVLLGAFFVRAEHLTPITIPDTAALGRAAVMLIFVFAGIEAGLVPSGEVRNPSRTVPRSLFLALLVVTLLYIAIQGVVQGVLGPRAPEFTDAPLAAAAQRFAGFPGRTLLLIAAVISMFGFVSGLTLAAPRALYALARDRLLPGPLAAVHPRFRTPHIAIIVQAVVVVLLAATGTFTQLVILANVAVLVLYLLCCAAAWTLQLRDVRGDGEPFRLPAGPLIPLLAGVMIMWLLWNAELREIAVVGAVIAGASVVYLATGRHRSGGAA
jgi:basic amino acid/polyamine antiporter, APA family